MQQKQSTSIVWFTDNLRVQDNSVLNKAMKNSERVIGIYFLIPKEFNKTQFGFKKTEKFRAKFLLDTLKDLKSELDALNISLLVFNSVLEDQISKLVNTYDVKAVYHQKEWTDEEIRRINSVKKCLPSDVIVHECYDQFLFHPDDVTFHYSETPKVFTQFRKQLERKSSVRPLVSVQPQKICSRVEIDFKLPTLEQLGFEDFDVDLRTACPFKGGSTSAEKRLDYYFFKTQSLGVYKKTRNGLLGENYSSKFSPWLANGSLSARQIYWKIKDFEQQFYANQSTYWLFFELIWRDFFKFISLKHGNAIFKLEGILNVAYNWTENSKFVKEWTEGRTADDFVNANMIELKNTGWMSNRGRQNVASFFAKTLKIDWRIGAAYFESMLLDYDVHSNYGNWMYVSGVGNDPRDRTFNLKRQAEMYDGDKLFRNHWLK